MFSTQFTQDTFNKFASPEKVIPYSKGDVTAKAHMCNPIFDYVPPELVTLFITNM